MDGISAAWLYPIIIVAGALQAWGRHDVDVPWLNRNPQSAPEKGATALYFISGAWLEFHRDAGQTAHDVARKS
jgi:hypothetical protein